MFEQHLNLTLAFNDLKPKITSMDYDIYSAALDISLALSVFKA